MKLTTFIFTNVLLFSLFPFLFFSYSHASSCSYIETGQNIRVFWPLTQERKSLILVFHGLNLKPEKMDQLSVELQKKGHLVVRPEFKAHRGVEEEMEKIREGDWSGDADCFIDYALKLATKENLHINFLGYSMGALFFLDSFLKLEKEKKDFFSRAIFLAPAIALRFYTDLVKIFYLFGDDYILSSQNPADYRSNLGTSMGGYKSLFSAIDRIKDNEDKKEGGFHQLRTLIFVDSMDELVSPSGLSHFIEESHLSHWEMRIVEKKGAGPNHLIIDKNSLGEYSFTSLVNEFDSFLKKDH